MRTRVSEGGRERRRKEGREAGREGGREGGRHSKPGQWDMPETFRKDYRCGQRERGTHKHAFTCSVTNKNCFSFLSKGETLYWQATA